MKSNSVSFNDKEGNVSQEAANDIVADANELAEKLEKYIKVFQKNSSCTIDYVSPQIILANYVLWHYEPMLKIIKSIANQEMNTLSSKKLCKLLDYSPEPEDLPENIKKLYKTRNEDGTVKPDCISKFVDKFELEITNKAEEKLLAEDELFNSRINNKSTQGSHAGSFFVGCYQSIISVGRGYDYSSSSESSRGR